MPTLDADTLTEEDRAEMREMILDIVRRGDRIIDDTMPGKPLTPDEVETLKAANFLRKVAPYVFQPKDE